MSRDELARIARDDHEMRERLRHRKARLRGDFRDPKARRWKKGRPRPRRGDR